MSSGGKMLIGESKYSFLKELGLKEVNDGVYNGKWFGSGEVRTRFTSLRLKLPGKNTVNEDHRRLMNFTFH